MFGRVFGKWPSISFNGLSRNGNEFVIRESRLLLLNCIPKSINNNGSNRQISQVKRIEEKKNERLLTLRTVVNDCYERMVKNQQQPPPQQKFDWSEVKQRLLEEGLYVSSNFEFSLLAAFDTTLPLSNESVTELDPKLFQLIADYVQQSPDVKTNKIAATRFCLFLSTFPHLLNQEHVRLIRSVAEQIASDSIHVSSIVIDIVGSLANSSADNCRYALELYPKLIKNDFVLKIQIVNILIKALIRYELKDELPRFLMEHHNLLTFDMEIIGNLLMFLSKAEYSNDNLFDIFRCLSQLMVPIDVKHQPFIVENILQHQLGYSDIDLNVSITKGGKCNRCGHQLTGLTGEEFAQLRENFRSIIFDKNDDYLIDNLPQYRKQLEEFEKRIIPNTGRNQREHPNYHLIIDGLNLGYQRSATIIRDKSGLRNYTKVNKVKNIDNNITMLIQSNKVLDRFGKSLLIGREHMKNWDKINRLIRSTRNHDRIDHFYLLNRTRDDNYILYAAVQHPETKILSNDYFRDHKEKFQDWYLLKKKHYNYVNTTINDEESSTVVEQRPNLYRLFHRWIRSRQIKLDSNNQLEFPNEFDICIHLNNSSSNSKSNPTKFPDIHIPIVVRKDIYNNDDHDIEWICARH